MSNSSPSFSSPHGDEPLLNQDDLLGKTHPSVQEEIQALNRQSSLISLYSLDQALFLIRAG